MARGSAYCRFPLFQDFSALDMEAKMMEKYKSKLAGNYTPKVNELYNIYVGRMKVHQ